MNDDAKGMNKADELGIICDMFGLNTRSLKTKIDVYSRDSSGKKIVVCKKLYSMEDVINDPENGAFYDAITKAIIRQCNLSHGDIVNFAYPDRETMEPNTLCIEITNYVEEDNKEDNEQQRIIDNNKRG